MSELPEGWIIASLEDISLKVTDGTHKTPNYLESGVRFISIKNIRPYKPIDWNVYERYIAKEEHAELIKRCHPEKGDIVFPRIGTLGFAKIVDWDDEFSIFVGLGLVKPNRNIVQSKYLEHYMNSPFVAEYSRSKATGTGRMTLALGDSKKLPVFLAPLAEQTRIAAKLDKLLAQVDTFKTRIDGIPALLKRFRQSVLAAAVSGRLTEEWRGGAASSPLSQPPLVFFERDQGVAPNGWDWGKLVSLAELESGHTPRKSVPGYWENGDVPWISLQDIRAADGKEILETKYMPTMLGIENSSARLLPKGTVCFSRDISVGFVTIMGRPMATTQHFANWVCKDQLLPKYLMYSFMAGRDHLLQSGQGSTVKTIYMPALKELRLLLPPIAEQTEIVHRVEQLFVFADQLEARVKTARARIDRLTQSILAKAFRGELVPQDPDDEPASVLLERIKAQRTAAPKAKRGRRAATSG
ncbi:MAG TPA: restriction endonuclease subunit S [Pseudomonas sp.]|jgi:type I restriction enzyme S subunit|uniref:restriction endonuclease subunit S n=1 Tax=Stutzerimonas xanthomarina TaxID=271420 RepID=UPI000E8A3B8D|nr:restriction endonuclease subunit S [Stutzerimonas xanthomarina]MBU0812546.1 restriction endonuclease subunit S [Gammaproteobacteria bacterium]HAQ89251.1 restriction endonuclease subunit S [Pseudomonas sp.]MBK3849500.1 restriction endonuclease subunit S [Stutzerimonas xanthomarina]MBU0854007.1 restriction endonuclease subunit S [Gammaproteobacteria bacterium]MBU1302249.1 restriction endonuclease subunit S [Gammaproteobacteria bacterium]